MTDDELRELERRWLFTRDVEDEAAYLGARLRLGRVAPRWVDLAARLGDPAARLVNGQPPLPPLEASPEVLRILGRLADTIAWLEPRRHVSLGLRSDALGAKLRERARQGASAEQLDGWTNSALCGRRAELLDREGWLSHVRARDLADGRLLLFAPDETLTDGAAEVASGGLFDATNLPAWDTWVQFVREPARTYLLCWIPPWAVSAADAGVRVNPEHCVEWADASSYALVALPLLRDVLARCSP